MPRVLILSAGDGHAALAAARALVASGHEVGVGGTGGGPWASRAVSRRHDVPPPEQGRDEFLRALGSAVAAGGYDVVFGAGDDWMAALALWREELDVVVGHPRARAVLASLDKYAIAEFGREAGLCVPRTVLARPGASEPWPDGGVVKSRRHWVPGRSAEGGRLEAELAVDAAGIERLTARIVAAGGEAVVQEVVEGRLMSVVVFVVDGEILLRLQQVASGTWPFPAGVTTRAETVSLDEDLVDGVGRLLRALEWSGVMQVEFVLPDAAPPVLIDLNGRFYGSMALAAAAGLDFATASVDLALHRRAPAAADASPGVRYQWLEGDLRRAVRERRGGLVADLLATAGASRGATGPVGIRTELGPAWQRCRRVVGEAPRRVIHR